MDNRKINKDLIDFWDSSIALNDELRREYSKIEDKDPSILAPSEKLYDAVKELGNKQKVLDYGCGNGWASIVASKRGCPDVTAVDLGANIIHTVNFYAELFDVKEGFHAIQISPDWLKKVPSKTYDGFVCSNVIDVIPLETSQEIIKEVARIVTDDARIVFGLNFYMSPESAKARGIELVDGKYLIMNGVLRLTSLKDEEWIELFNPYFEIEKLDYFAWPGEPKETRRLFILKKR